MASSGLSGREMSIPSSMLVVRYASSSGSRRSTRSPAESISTLNPRLCISFTSTRKLSGTPGSGGLSPRTMAS